MSTSLQVFHSDALVGQLVADEQGLLTFSYDPTWLSRSDSFPVSISLPLQRAPVRGGAAHAFFAGLLPEGPVRETIARRLGLSVGNDVALLEALGAECAGALSILPAGTTPESLEGSYERLEPDVIARMAQRRSVFATAVGEHKARLSLAGAQDKLPVRHDPDGSLWLPMDGAPSTHILKVPSRDFKHLPVNEVITLNLARALGLETASARLIDVQDTTIALIERYDRCREGSENEILRLHQEDLCQALGQMPSRKYQQEGGPSFSDAMQVVRSNSLDPLNDSARLIDWQIFNVLTGNSDGHGKNLSLLHTTDGCRLAPFYDLVCTRVYPDVDRMLAMSICQERDPGQIAKRHWEAMAQEVNVGKRLIHRKVEQWCEEVPQRFEEVVSRLSERHQASPAVERIEIVINKQCRRSLHLLSR